MYFGYLLYPPPPLRELARPAEWGFVYMFITGQMVLVLIYAIKSSTFFRVQYMYKEKAGLQG